MYRILQPFVGKRHQTIALSPHRIYRNVKARRKAIRLVISRIGSMIFISALGSKQKLECQIHREPDILHYVGSQSQIPA